MNNPVFHDFPGNPLSPAQMHHEVKAERHADCTLQTCNMLRFCWTKLIELGHLHPSDPPEQCPTCTSLPA